MVGEGIEISEPMTERTTSLDLTGPHEFLVTRSIRAAFTPDGRVAEHTRRVKGGKPTDKVPERLPNPPVATVDEPAVWGGGLVAHYGHFLTESVARLWPLLPGGPVEGAGVVFVPLNAGNPQFAEEWLRAFGARCFTLPASGAVRFANMYVPEPAWQAGGYFTREARAIHLHARRGLQVPPLSPVELTYLSRRQIKEERRVAGEQELEDRITGWATIRSPERLPLAEQVAVFECSDRVAGIVGSALHTVLLCQRVPRCVYLAQRRVTGGFIAQDRLVGGGGDFHRCIDVTPAKDGVPAVRRLNVHKALGALV